jgi:peptide deformylase
MDAQTNLRQYIDRLEYALRAQMDKINELRAENKRLIDWVMGDTDALTTLQSVYSNPTAPEGNRIKAAAAAIGYERPKVAVTANLVVVDFRERVRQARLKASFVEPKVIEHQP